jgi:hypothetical protein
VTKEQQNVAAEIVEQVRKNVPCGEHSGFPGDVSCGEWNSLCPKCAALKKLLKAYDKAKNEKEKTKGRTTKRVHAHN